MTQKQSVIIKGLKLTNFGKFSAVEVKFDGKTTYLVGPNGAGKTTLGCTAFWAGLKGIAERTKEGQIKGERYRFIGRAGKSAKIELVLYDEVRKIEVIVTNRITKSGSNIEFKPPEGVTLDKEWIDSLFNAAFISAKSFAQLDPKAQTIALGIETSEHDGKIAKIKDAYTDINREFKALGAIEPVERVERVDLHELYAEKENRITHNKKQDDISKARTDFSNDISDFESELAEIQSKISETQRKLDGLPEEGNRYNTLDIQEQIDDADEINRKAGAYEAHVKNLAAKEVVEDKLEANRTELVKASEDRLEYIKTFDFGFKGLTVDDKGGLLFGDRRISEPYFSRGELEVIVAKLRTAQNHGLKTVFIDDADVLDPKNLKKIMDMLHEAGFQVILSFVGEVATKDNTILLSECKVVNGDEEEGETLI